MFIIKGINKYYGVLLILSISLFITYFISINDNIVYAEPTIDYDGISIREDIDIYTFEKKTQNDYPYKKPYSGIDADDFFGILEMRYFKCDLIDVVETTPTDGTEVRVHVEGAVTVKYDEEGNETITNVSPYFNDNSISHPTIEYQNQIEGKTYTLTLNKDSDTYIAYDPIETYCEDGLILKKVVMNYEIDYYGYFKYQYNLVVIYDGYKYFKELKELNHGDDESITFVADPVNIATGNFYTQKQDLLIPDIGQNLQITRSYNALDTRNSIIGKGWRLNYDTTLSENSSTGNVTIIYPNGRTAVFYKEAGSNKYNTPETVFDVLTKNPDNTFSLELENKLTYKYNSQGQLISIIDKNDNTITLDYDGSGNLQTVTGEGGKTLTFSFVGSKLQTITDDLNRTIKYNYDGSNNLIQVIDTGDNKTIYSYNSHGITSITDGNNKTYIENQYDQFGRVIRQYDEDNNITDYTYDDINRINTYTFQSTGKSVKYHYNDKLYITKEVFDDGTYEEYTYDQWGNKNSIKDRNGNITSYLYDIKGNLLKITSPSPFNYETVFEYDTNDNIERITRPSGASVTYEYDTNENLTKETVKVTDTLDAVTSYTYDVKGRVETIADPENNITTFQYQNHKQPVKIIDPEDNEVSYTYDDVGRKQTVTNDYGRTTFEYNNLDKITKIIDDNGNVTRMKYDGQGNLIKLIKPEQYNQITDDGIGSVFEYDAMDRLLNQIDPLGNILAKKYDVEGNVIKEINPNYYNPTTEDGIGIEYEYDKTGRLIRIVNPSGEKSRIIYDGAGNTVKTIDFNNYNESMDSGEGIQYQYDSLNRLTKVIDTDGNVIQKLIYDEDGNVIKSIDAKGYLSGSDDNTRYGKVYKYNLAGWLLEKRVPLKNEQGTIYYNITTYTYDKAGRLIQEKKSQDYVTIDSQPSISNTITYTYYKNGLIETISDTTGSYIEYQYDALGNTTLEKSKIDDTRYNIKGYYYDNLGRLTRSFTEIDGADLKDVISGTVLAETIFEYDKNSNIIKITSPEGYITEFEYDNADRLIKKTEQVPEDHIDVKGTTASVTLPRRILYPGEEYQYKVNIKPDGQVTAIDLDIEYDTRFFEILNVTPHIDGLTTNSYFGDIRIDAYSVNLINKTNIATITVKVKDTVTGTGYIKINPLSTYTDGIGSQYRFIEANGKTTLIKQPDMNDDNIVETNDFTLTSILKDIDKYNLKYHEKFDIDASEIIDTKDLDYIKDWLFEEKSNNISLLQTQEFYEKHITPVYEVTTNTVTRQTTYSYDKAGNLITETDTNNNTITYTYDENNRLIRVTDKENNTSRIFYDEAGNVIKEVIPENYNTASDDGVGTTYEYDSMNRLVKITDAQGNVVQKNIYDINGLNIKVIDAKGYQSASNDNNRYGIEYTYDIGNRLKTITTPEAKTKGKTSTKYTYDAQSNILSFTDGENNTTTYERDLWGNATKVTDGEGIENTYIYNYAGNIISSTDGKNQTTTYTYNSMNLISSITDALNQTITYKYDKAGRLTLQIDRNGNTILYDYNRDNNMTSRRIMGDDLEEKFLYNKDGSLLAAINSSSIETYEYTPNGYLQNKYLNGQNILSYGYNKNGNVKDITDQTGQTTSYIYDTIGRMKTVLDEGVQLAEYNYNIDSTITSINYNTGINISYTYDLDKNIETILSTNPQGGTIENLSYTYYNNGNVKTKVRDGQTTIYTYDKSDRLKTENNPISGLMTYSYDDAHNIVQKQVGEQITTYNHDKNNRLIESITNEITTTYSYDNNGNLLREENINKTTNYIYNKFNKLKQVTKSDGSWMYSHYNAQGLRIGTEESGIYYGFTFERGSIITEVDSNNELISRSIRGYSLIANKDKREVLSYYLHNSHGDITNLVDENGQVLNSYDYDAFGNTLNQVEQVSNRFMYAGEQFDKVTEHYYLRARYYAPNIGRFTQEDTFRGDGLNLYAYVSNNPVMYIDPSGYCKDETVSTSNLDPYGIGNGGFNLPLRNAQEFLDTLGYTSVGKADGLWGTKTRGALENYLGRELSDGEYLTSETYNSLKKSWLESENNGLDSFWTERIDSWVSPLKGSPTVNPLVSDNYLGARRSKGKRAHAGLDYHADVGTEVVAMTDGVIESVTYFYSGTYAVTVKNTDGTVIRYGEIMPSSDIATVRNYVNNKNKTIYEVVDYKKSKKVMQGEILGTVIMNTDKNPQSMLHLELFMGIDKDGNIVDGSYRQVGNFTYDYVDKTNFERSYERRRDLYNPSGSVYLQGSY